MKPDTSDTNYVYAEGKDALTVFGDSDEKVQVWIGDGWADRLSKSQAYSRGDFYRKPKHLVKQSFSIYEAPVRGSANEMEHRFAIMKAAWGGDQVEYFGLLGWQYVNGALWGWDSTDYRIKKPTPQPKIASGHNPDNLTEDQVGVKDGWRLLGPDEILPRPYYSHDIEAWGGIRWISSGFSGSVAINTYRTKKHEGYYLPKKKELKPWTFETAPKGCVLIRKIGICRPVAIVIWWGSHGLRTRGDDYNYSSIVDVCEHSLDGGATWNPCGTYE